MRAGHTGRVYHGEAVYRERAEHRLAELHATPAEREAVHRTAITINDNHRIQVVEKGTRRQRSNQAVGLPRADTWIDRATPDWKRRSSLADIALDLALADRGCHAGAARYVEAA